MPTSNASIQPEPDSDQRPVEFNFSNSGASSMGATVYVQTNVANLGGDCKISGSVRGPFSKKSQTLPATFKVDDLGAGPTVLGRVHITDPCTWSTRLPVVYRADVVIQRGDEVIHDATAEFGIRSNVSATGKSLWIGKRTVLRGADSQRAMWTDITEWTDHNAALLIDEPSDELCQVATDQGVLIVARIVETEDLVRRVRRLAANPSVHIVWIDSAAADAELVDKVDEPNILLAVNLDNAIKCENAPVVVWQVGDSALDAVLSVNKPVLAIRPLASQSPLAAARAACDELQRDLAPQLDLAGYFV